jgi:SAM-dependent methyltransferase
VSVRPGGRRAAEREELIWHELECGSYRADLPLWRGLAAEFGDPILDVGAGAGRVALELARQGHRVTALDRNRTLLAQLRSRAAGLPVEVVHADARSFALRRRFALIIVPMQTIQLLGGAPGRRRFLACAVRHLKAHGAVAVALAERLEAFDIACGDPPPVPDMCEREGILYSSLPTAIRARPDGYVLERRRERMAADGTRSSRLAAVMIERLSGDQLEREGRRAGLEPGPRRPIPATAEHAGGVVVVMHG